MLLGVSLRAPGVHARRVEGVLLALVLLLVVGRLLPAGESGPFPRADELAHRVDLNRAAWHELTDLPGIGEAKARAIVRDRRERGPFRSPDDLARVPGIGPETIRRLSRFTHGDS